MPRLAFGRYQPHDSWVHGLDPRAKILALLTLVVAVFLLDRWWEYVLMFSTLWGGAALSRLRARELFQGVYAVSVLIAISFFLQLVFTPGEALFRWGIVSFSRPGLYSGLTLAGRLALLSTFSMLLGMTTNSAALAEAIRLLLLPLQRVGLPVRRVALVLALGLRFVPVVLDQGEQILKAQRARGINFAQGSVFRRARRLFALFIPLLRACIRRAEALALAMDARGYRLGAPRSCWRPLRLRAPDVGALAWAALVLALVLS